MNESTLKKKVKEWLEKTGLPLEMEAATAFQNQGFLVVQSSIYEDPESAQGREIDVVAYDNDMTGIVQVHFVIECKSSPHPWVVLETDHSVAPPLAYFGVCSARGRIAVLNSFYRDGGGGLLRVTRAFPASGYGLRQAFCGDKDPAYAASMSVIKASRALAFGQKSETDERISVAVPVLVVDAPILTCRRTEDGDIQLEQTELAYFYFEVLIPQRTTAVVRIVSRRSLSQFAESCRVFADTIKAEMQPEVDAWAESQHKNRKPTTP